MERLTKTSDLGGVAFTFDLDITCQPNEIKKILNLATKLKEFEDLEEQGRLIKLPCKVGDVVYFAHHDRVISSEVLSAKYHAEAENHGVFIRERLTIDVEGVSAEIDFGDIGKTVFLTKSEAEAKLKELMDGQRCRTLRSKEW